jgi:hypothetical protein
MRRVDSLSPPTQPLLGRISRMIVGGVIGRAAKTATGPQQKALMDSADRVLRTARADISLDPEVELAGYEAIMRTILGEHDAAMQLLGRYVSKNPDHSFEVAGNVHWWWQELQARPAFARLRATAR